MSEPSQLKTFTTTEPETQQTKHNKEGIAKSMLSDVAEELGLEGLFQGEVTHLSFDCPRNLREAFKEEVKRNGSSVCKELQKSQLSYIVASRIKKHAFGNTLSKLVDVPVSIGALNVNQYVQSRVRRYAKTEVFLEEVTQSVSACVLCSSEAFAVVTRADKSRVSLCYVHFAKEKPLLLGWRVLE